MHLYVHIPFCHRICPYCSFHKHTPANTNIRKFVDALLTEAAIKQKENPSKLETVYFGGGTPSMLSDTHLRRLFNGLKETFDWNEVKEVTFETNPATFTEKRAAFFKELGITRISLGVQSWDPDILGILGREHTPEQAADSIRLLRDAGIPEINVDLMFSIPGQSLEVWERTLITTLEQNPEHISAYNLTYEEDTEFFRKLGSGEWDNDPDQDAHFFEKTHDLLTQAGYRHYETSNFARDGHLSKHNLSYWQGEDYLGLGPGAVGTVKRQRFNNHPFTPSYIEQTLATGTPPHTVEVLTDNDLKTERIALLLRTDMGLPLDFIQPDLNPFVQSLYEEELAETGENRLILTPRGRLLVDEIAVRLIP